MEIDMTRTDNQGIAISGFTHSAKGAVQVTGTNMSALTLSTSGQTAVAQALKPQTVVQYTSNPHGIATSSVSTGLQLSAFGVGSTSTASSRRRLGASSTSSVGVKIILENIESVSYYSIPAVNGSVLLINLKVGLTRALVLPCQCWKKSTEMVVS